MKRRVLWIGALLFGFGMLGILISASGIIPLRASSGHWPITRWILQFSMQRSIVTHSLGIEVPPLDDPGLILKGAGHYETACMSCHGAPGKSVPQVVRKMLPPPPPLAPLIKRRHPRELFYVVKHGLKFTGMPAWPTQQRDDEVWAMIAFLLKLPELDEAGYERLARGTLGRASLAEVPGLSKNLSRALRSCARCHGMDGMGRGSDFIPKLAGQSADYTQNALEAFARGQRPSGIMTPITAELNSQEIRELAHYFARLKPSATTASSPVQDKEALERGRTIAHFGIPRQRVPSCLECHGSGGKNRNPAYPALAGQPAEYLYLQLQLFKASQRGGSEYAHLMNPVAGGLTPDQMRDVALYFEREAER